MARHKLTAQVVKSESKRSRERHSRGGARIRIQFVRQRSPVGPPSTAPVTVIVVPIGHVGGEEPPPAAAPQQVHVVTPGLVPQELPEPYIGVQLQPPTICLLMPAPLWQLVIFAAVGVVVSTAMVVATLIGANALTSLVGSRVIIQLPVNATPGPGVGNGDGAPEIERPMVSIIAEDENADAGCPIWATIGPVTTGGPS